MSRKYPSRRWALLAVPTFCVLLYLLIFHVEIKNFHIIFSLSPDERRVESYDFQQTAEEISCFSGVANSSISPIPNVVHFTWGLAPGSISRMSFMNYLAIRSALESLRPDELKLHYAYLDENDPWLMRIREKHHITLVQHDMAREYPEQVKQRWKVSHLADALRLDILFKEGGIYLDMDVISLRPFDDIRHGERDVVLGHEGGDRRGLCNAVILARPNASFIARWIESYRDFSPGEWNYHSVLLPKKLQSMPEHRTQVCPLSPTAFFWPTWTKKHVRYLHEPISDEEAEELERMVEANGGGLYANQLAYHAWNQVARSPYLQHLTPEIVRDKNTRFNVLVRRFVN